MRFTWPDSKALILKSGKELITSFVAAAMVVAMGFAIGSTISGFGPGPLATVQRC